LQVAEREDIQRSVKRGIKDIEAVRFEEYDADGLRVLAKELVAAPSGNEPPARKRD